MENTECSMTTGKCQCLPEFFERKKKCLPGKTMPPCPAAVVNNNDKSADYYCCYYQAAVVNDNDSKLTTTAANTRLVL